MRDRAAESGVMISFSDEPDQETGKDYGFSVHP